MKKSSSCIKTSTVICILVALVCCSFFCGAEQGKGVLSERTALQAPRAYSDSELRDECHKRLSNEQFALVEYPLAITPDIAKWAQHLIPEAPPAGEIAEKIFSDVSCLVGTSRPDNSALTAQQAFDLWSKGQPIAGVAPTHLYVALCRAARIDAWVVDVVEDVEGKRMSSDQAESWSIGQLCAAIQVGGDLMMADPRYRLFPAPHRKVSVLDDLQATALYMASKAASVATTKPDAALPLAEVAAKLYPESFFAHYTLGACLDALDRRAAGMKEAQICLSIEPESPLGLITLASCKARLGEPSEALRLAKRGLDLKPRAKWLTAQGYWIMGVAYWNSGEHKKALRYVVQAIQLAPDEQRYRDGWARMRGVQIERK